MGRRRSYERRDLPPNLYVRKNGYYSYRDPRSGKEFGLGRDRRVAITEAIQANLEFFKGEERQPLSTRIAGIDSITFHQWLVRYEVIIAGRGLKEKTLRDYASKIRTLREKIDDLPLPQITTRFIASLLNDYADEGKAPMARLLRSTLSDIFREAIVEGHISENPVTATRTAKYTVKRSRLTFDEYQEIRKAADKFPAWVGVAMDLALVTGQRLGDLVEMRRPNISNGLLHIEQGKTSSKVAIPLKIKLAAANLCLSDIIERCVKSHSTNQLLTSQKGESVSAKSLSRYFLLAREESGLKFDGVPPSFHEIRSLSARMYDKQEGKDFSRRLLGHKSDTMASQYRNDRGREWDVIDVG
ncbi:phage integrase Arm DNA-binding domain-containing protein [Klebsiella sp. CN_Kp100]|uniref:phage integrase Arm DNA-binding domain-containing protein n=1 Tax=Klebsiella sp. CN_Kp100 TaxID=3153422 RepID=UPI0032B5382E